MPYLIDQKLISGAKWYEENRKIWEMMNERNRATFADPIWSSELFPVTAKKTKKKRILVIGDSFCWGDGYINLNTIWWRQLQQELNRRGYSDVEVLGAGLCGMQTDFQLVATPHLLKTYKPDIVIWGYVTNDACEHIELHPAMQIVKHFEARDSKWIYAVRDITSKVFPEVTLQLYRLRKAARTKKYAGPVNGYPYDEWELKLLSGENFESYKKTVANLFAVFNSNKIPLFVMTLPSGFANSTDDKSKNQNREDTFIDRVYEYHAQRYEPVEKLYKSNHINFLNTLEPFVQAAAKDKFVSSSKSELRLGINPENGHPGPFCTHFYAQKAADELEKNYRFALPSKSTFAQPFLTPSINDALPISIKLKKIGDRKYSFQHPTDSSKLLSLAVGKPYVQLNFENPLPIKGLRIQANELQSLNSYCTFIDKATGYVQGSASLVGSGKGKVVEIEFSAQNQAKDLSSILINAEIKGKDRIVELELL